MPVPRANLGGPFGGGPVPTAHPIDLSGAIDAAFGGATTLLHNAYLRKIAEARMQMEQRRFDQEDAARQEDLRIKRAGLLEKGVHLGETGDPTYVPQENVHLAAPVARAQATGEQARQTEAVRQQGRVELEQKRATGRLTMQDVKNAHQDDRDQALQLYHQQNLELAGKIRGQVDAHRIGLQQSAKASAPLTPAQSLARRKYLTGLIATASSGDPDKAEEILMGDGGLAHEAGALGVGRDEVRAAATGVGAKQDAATEKAATGLVGSGMSTVGEAVPKVQTIRTQVRTSRLRAPKAATPPAAAPVVPPVANIFGDLIPAPKKTPED